MTASAADAPASVAGGIPDIRLVGTGIELACHLTPEAEAALRASRRVYHLTAFHDVLACLCDDVVDWQQLYLASHSTDVYTHMADVLLREGSEQGNVAFAVYGHPLVFVSTSVIVINRAPELGLTVDVVSGISSIDVLLSYLLLDAGLTGLQILDPWSIIEHDEPPNPAVACFVMQVASLADDALNTFIVCPPERLRPLQDVLLRVYAPEHPAVFVAAPYLPGTRGTRVETTVGALTQAPGDVHTGMTLYLPPARRDKPWRR